MSQNKKLEEQLTKKEDDEVTVTQEKSTNLSIFDPHSYLTIAKISTFILSKNSQ